MIIICVYNYYNRRGNSTIISKRSNRFDDFKKFECNIKFLNYIVL